MVAILLKVGNLDEAEAVASEYGNYCSREQAVVIEDLINGFDDQEGERVRNLNFFNNDLLQKFPTFSSHNHKTFRVPPKKLHYKISHISAKYLNFYLIFAFFCKSNDDFYGFSLKNAINMKTNSIAMGSALILNTSFYVPPNICSSTTGWEPLIYSTCRLGLQQNFHVRNRSSPKHV